MYETTKQGQDGSPFALTQFNQNQSVTDFNKAPPSEHVEEIYP